MLSNHAALYHLWLCVVHRTKQYVDELFDNLVSPLQHFHRHAKQPQASVFRGTLCDCLIVEQFARL